MLLIENVFLLRMSVCRYSPDHALDFEGLDGVVADTGMIQARITVPALLLHKKPQFASPFLPVDDVFPEVLILLGVYQFLLVRGFLHVRECFLVLGLGTRCCLLSALSECLWVKGSLHLSTDTLVLKTSILLRRNVWRHDFIIISIKVNFLLLDLLCNTHSVVNGCRSLSLKRAFSCFDFHLQIPLPVESFLELRSPLEHRVLLSLQCQASYPVVSPLFLHRQQRMWHSLAALRRCP